jgi:hypothetical protein
VLSSILWNDFSITYRLEYTCSNCHFVCHPDKEVRKAQYMMLTESGVVIEEPDGTRRSVSPEEANEYIKSMPRNEENFTSQFQRRFNFFRVKALKKA